VTGGQIRGAVVPARPGITPESFDRAHGTTAKSELMWRLAREAYGADYPGEVQPWGMTTWWTLGRFVSGLRVGAGQHLLDLACGRGGVGLWLARATGARLTGVDWSPAAVREAAARAPQFVPAQRASFTVGDLAATGLEPGSVDAAVCADAIFFALDRVAVFAEMTRVLRPGARFVFTADESADPARPAAVPDWAPIAEAGGLIVDSREEIPHWREGLQRTYDTWTASIDEVRRSLGDESANDLIEEATQVGPTLAGRTGVLYTTRRR
jgi:ubiquinone/menaquinone biosynthesis C-methylase UbiE